MMPTFEAGKQYPDAAPQDLLDHYPGQLADGNLVRVAERFRNEDLVAQANKHREPDKQPVTETAIVGRLDRAIEDRALAGRHNPYVYHQAYNIQRAGDVGGHVVYRGRGKALFTGQIVFDEGRNEPKPSLPSCSLSNNPTLDELAASYHREEFVTARFNEKLVSSKGVYSQKDMAISFGFQRVKSIRELLQPARRWVEVMNRPQPAAASSGLPTDLDVESWPSLGSLYNGSSASDHAHGERCGTGGKRVVT